MPLRHRLKCESKMAKFVTGFWCKELNRMLLSKWLRRTTVADLTMLCNNSNTQTTAAKLSYLCLWYDVTRQAFGLEAYWATIAVCSIQWSQYQSWLCLSQTSFTLQFLAWIDIIHHHRGSQCIYTWAHMTYFHNLMLLRLSQLSNREAQYDQISF